MPRLNVTMEEVQSPQRRRAFLVGLDGVISTPTMMVFRDTLRDPVESGIDVILDMGEVSYINSTGIGEILRAGERLRVNNCHLLLVSVRPEVKRLIEILGLDAVFSMRPTLAGGLAALDEELQYHEIPAVGPEKPRTRRSVRLPDAGSRARLPEARLVLGLKSFNHFGRFLQRCFSGKVDETLVAAGREDFERILDGGKIDIAVLDSELPGFHEICALLKTSAPEGLLSIIAIYSEGMDGENGAASFRVLEDELLVEPFEAAEILALIEREFRRCQEQGILFRREASFSFICSEEGIAAAAETFERLLSHAEMEDSARDAFLYAVREGVDNARRHGNGSDPEKRIDFMYIHDREKITVAIRDQGPGFDFKGFVSRSRKLSPVEQARERHRDGKHGGLGINLMLRCCDEVEYMPPGNMLRLTKYL